MRYVLNLPRIQRVRLEGFSLYNLQPSIDLIVPEGVFCLAGANGLGKSTFLTALNYGLTGIVRDPKRSFQSASFEEYYRDSIKYSNEFFTGRIGENERDYAAVSVDFDLEGERFHLVRGIFEPQELREISIYNAHTETLVLDGESLSPSERQTEYAKLLVQRIGIGTFFQFAFLQLFLFTFDESRTLVFWDQRVLNRALSLCFGVAAEKVELADRLYREMERAASLARNANWQASSVKNEIEHIRRSLDEITDNTSTNVDGDKMQQTQTALEQARQELASKQSQLDDAELALMQLTSEISGLQSDYANLFERYAERNNHKFSHPVVVTSINENRCEVCGTHGIAASITLKVTEEICPLCNTQITTDNSSDDFLSDLQRIDSVIVQKKSEAESIQKTKYRIQNEVLSTRQELHSIERELKSIEDGNEQTLFELRAASSGLESALRIKTEEMQKHLQRKDEKYTERDRKRNEFLRLQKEISQKYVDAETEFVPLFKRLAYLFLGMDLDIRRELNSSVTNPGFTIALEVRGQMRREAYQLSESQRFFVDIALRMALAQYTTGDKGGSCLFIDTPEGSLDIAYETRAGLMFAEYVRAGHNIIMTANINSSQILRKLALECGGQKMTLHRMTDWTELTAVQMSEPLLEQAYEDIEGILNTSKPINV